MEGPFPFICCFFLLFDGRIPVVKLSEETEKNAVGTVGDEALRPAPTFFFERLVHSNTGSVPPLAFLTYLTMSIK